ncbi:hypothetical protein [Rothia sp. ZJ932]|uniref:hypothetical protein n=1 Tax=Rothia sp. ZJ932 TaxID=2810516 RepID=UPI00196877AA|nr:hypothetical protein [Rothia sp. ZJ932]QRZ61665.1 hypothetical protein JR346_00500 [Rothia sp. ZJ932]
MTSSINRRSLVKGAAWAAPVVAATTAIPAYAASARSCPTVTIAQTAGNVAGTYVVTVIYKGTAEGMYIGGVTRYNDVQEPNQPAMVEYIDYDRNLFELDLDATQSLRYIGPAKEVDTTFTFIMGNNFEEAEFLSSAPETVEFVPNSLQIGWTAIAGTTRCGRLPSTYGASS